MRDPGSVSEEVAEIEEVESMTSPLKPNEAMQRTRDKIGRGGKSKVASR
jgi:hypothetical protein